MKTFFLKNMTISFVIIFVISFALLALTQSSPAKSKPSGRQLIGGHSGVIGTTGVTGFTGTTGYTGPNNFDERKPEKGKTKYDEQSSNNN